MKHLEAADRFHHNTTQTYGRGVYEPHRGFPGYTIQSPGEPEKKRFGGYMQRVTVIREEDKKPQVITIKAKNLDELSSVVGNLETISKMRQIQLDLKGNTSPDAARRREEAKSTYHLLVAKLAKTKRLTLPR